MDASAPMLDRGVRDHQSQIPDQIDVVAFHQISAARVCHRWEIKARLEVLEVHARDWRGHTDTNIVDHV